MKRNNRAKNGSLRNSSTDSTGATCDAEVNAPERKEGGRNKLVRKRGIPESVKRLTQVDSSKNRPRTQFGFVEPI